jgi:ribosomal protein L39E
MLPSLIKKFCMCTLIKIYIYYINIDSYYLSVKIITVNKEHNEQQSWVCVKEKQRVNKDPRGRTWKELKLKLLSTVGLCSKQKWLLITCSDIIT